MTEAVGPVPFGVGQARLPGAPLPLAAGEAAGRLGNSLRGLDELQVATGQRYGNTRAYRALASNPVARGAVQGGRAIVGAVTPATDLAGSLTSLAKVQEQAAKDISELSRVLADPHATLGQRLIASAKATQSAANYLQSKQGFLSSLTAADRAYLERSGLYARLSTPARPAVNILGKVNGSIVSPVVKVATVVGAGAGVVVGAVALPGLVRGTVDAGKRLAAVIDDPAASDDQKLAAVADTARGGAGAVMAANGIRTGVQTLGTVAAGSRLLGPAVARLTASPAVGAAGRVLGGLFKVLLPVADAGMLVADSVKLKQTMANPAATGMDKAKAILAVGLGVIKIATYLMPQTLFLRAAYMVASFGQLGIAMVDLGHSLGPALRNTASGLAWALAHPGDALRKAGAAITGGFARLGATLEGGLTRIGTFLSAPGQSVQAGRVWASGAWDTGREALQAAWDVGRKSVALIGRKLHSGLAGSPAATAPGRQVPTPPRHGKPPFAPIGPTLPAPAGA